MNVVICMNPGSDVKFFIHLFTLRHESLATKLSLFFHLKRWISNH